MSPTPTMFKNMNGKLVQSLCITPRYWPNDQKYTIELPYDTVFNARVKVKDIFSYYKGSTYVEWISDTGNTYYSNIHDYRAIVTGRHIEDGGWISTLFTFKSRGGRNRSLTLASVSVSSEPKA